MFIPLISTVLVERGLFKKSIRKKLGIGFRFNKWYVFAWLIAPVLTFSTLVISLIFPEVEYSPDLEGLIERYRDMLTEEQIAEMRSELDSLPVHPIWLMIPQSLLAGLSVNAIFAFGEEIGWRGYLVRVFENHSFIKSAFWIGLIWGLWHAPLILMGHNYPQHPYIGSFAMILWCLLLSPLFLFIRLKTKSVFGPTILHGTLNAIGGVSIMLVSGGSDLIIGITGLSGFIALVVLNALLWFFNKSMFRETLKDSMVDS